MWNRAARTDSFSSTKQSPNVSPASYNPYPTSKIKPCHVPFNRSTNALALADTDVPAPCTYNIKYRKQRIKGGASLRFTDPRVTFSRKPGPSPLSYDPDLLYQQKHKYKIKGKLYRGTPPRDGFVCPVSVPSKLFDGFDIIQGRGLVLRPPRVEFRKRVEPIFRNFPYELCSTTLKYKGNQWSKLTAQRKFMLSGDPDIPGVGSYDLLDKPPDPFTVHLVKLRSHNIAVAESLRSNDMFIRNMINEDPPGPCSYEVEYKRVYGLYSFNVKGTFPRAKRFRYESKITMQQPLNLHPPPTITSRQKAWPPFNSSSRARPRIKEAGTSPAQANVYNDSIVFNLVKKLLAMKIIAPFGSLADRKPSFIPNEQYPGPGTYDLREKPRRIICGVRDRYTYIPPIKLTPLKDLNQGEVAPWSYDLSVGINAICGRKDCHKGPTWIKEKDFDRTKWAIKDGPDALYDSKDVRALHCGQPIFNERPKPKLEEITPGPADYHIHPRFTEACLRAHMTQNATSDLQYVNYFKYKPVRRNIVQYSMV